jgi:RNA polymerase sigma-70 factor (ECF subfamily)
MNNTTDTFEEYHEDNKDQLEYMIRRFGKQVLKLAYYYLRDRYLSEDIYQEVFIKVYQNLGRFRGESSYFTWIYRITTNLCKDYLKSAAFRKLVSIGAANDLNMTSREMNKLFEIAEGGEIFSAVMNLPKKYRIPISLYYFEGFSTSEIAEILQISESNVKVRLHRGREKLKTMLREEDKE